MDGWVSVVNYVNHYRHRLSSRQKQHTVHEMSKCRVVSDTHTSGQGRRHGVDWGGHVHPNFARGRS